MGKKKKKIEEENLSTPWEQVHHRLQAFFLEEPDIHVDEKIVDDDNNGDIKYLNVYVYDSDKYISLQRILQKQFEFSGVVLNIKLILDDQKDYDPVDDLITVLYDNPLFDEVQSIIDPIMKIEYKYCLFKKKVVQYYDDIFSDTEGMRTTLAQDMAPEIFNVEGVFYCTDK